MRVWMIMIVFMNWACFGRISACENQLAHFHAFGSDQAIG
jgi:hypothetical protein